QYEINMLTAMTLSLVRMLDPGTLMNACYESFLIHARQLIWFLENHPRLKDTDIIASDYLADKTSYSAQRPPSLNSVIDATETRLVHLTTLHTLPAPAVNCVDAACEIQAWFTRFVKVADHTLLHPKVVALVSGWKSGNTIISLSPVSTPSMSAVPDAIKLYR
ncbi:MAG TPA: hypothetical protein VGK81_04175, partial [Anaerolineae bacterium]